MCVDFILNKLQKIAVGRAFERPPSSSSHDSSWSQRWSRWSQWSRRTLGPSRTRTQGRWWYGTRLNSVSKRQLLHFGHVSHVWSVLLYFSALFSLIFHIDEFIYSVFLLICDSWFLTLSDNDGFKFAACI